MPSQISFWRNTKSQMVIYQITFPSTSILGYLFISSIYWFLNYLSWLVSMKKKIITLHPMNFHRLCFLLKKCTHDDCYYFKGNLVFSFGKKKIYNPFKTTKMIIWSSTTVLMLKIQYKHAIFSPFFNKSSYQPPLSM